MIPYTILRLHLLTAIAQTIQILRSHRTTKGTVEKIIAASLRARELLVLILQFGLISLFKIAARCLIIRGAVEIEIVVIIVIVGLLILVQFRKELIM